MAKKLTKEQKQDIRDKIGRLEHLKDPYLKVFQLALPIFITMILFIMGGLNNQTANMFDIKYYNLTFVQNSSSNLSSISQATITPIKGLNLPTFHSVLNSIWFIPILIYLMVFVLYYYLVIYTRYDNDIKILYNQLIGFKIKSKIKKLMNPLIKNLLFLLLGIVIGAIIGLIAGYILFHK
ncbi:MAG: hypothetical protein Q8N63_03515 [Nanoarchaeota archaeon]|nr:hypothetical protein [Nanoarchaeota archaeon]